MGRRGFIGQVLKTGGNFIGKVNKVANFVGRVSPHVANAARFASGLAQSAGVANAAKDFGVGAQRLQQAAGVLDRTSQVAGAIPGAIRGVADSTVGVKRDLAALYKAAHS